VLIENNANGAINLQQLGNNMYYRSSHGSCHFVRKPKSASKIRLVHWPVLLETRASRLPTTWYAGQPIAIGWQAACRLHAPRLCLPSCSWYSFTDPGGMEGWV